MRGPHNILRLIRTGATFERSGAMRVVLDAFEAPRALRVAARVLGWPFRWLGIKGDPDLPPVTRALTALGPAYIKFGQILSTRPDVVGEELAMQLRVLQDRLAPFPMATAKRTIAQELGQPVESLFSEFSEPIAAASIAQVHKARLADTGEPVAVKVLRPGIERAFRRDIDAFYFAARMVELLSPGSRRLKPMDVIAHFEGVVLGELDLRLETAGAAEFAATTKDDAGFGVPEVHWFQSARRVMTLGWVEGIPLGDVDAIDVSSTWEEILHIVVEAGRTRFPVYQKTLDNVVGVLYVKDLLPLLANGQVPDRELADIIRKPWTVPTDRSVELLLREFLHSRSHMAIVLDEFQQMAGVVTIEDALEEIVGEIVDESDEEEEFVIEIIDEETVEVDGRVMIDDLNDTLGWDLPESDDYETVAGYVLSHTGVIPDQGHRLTIGDAEIEILKASKRKIESMRVHLNGRRDQKVG